MSNSATVWTVACKAPLFMGFSRQEYRSGSSCPPPEDLPDPGIEPLSPVSPALQVDSLLLSHQGSPKHVFIRLQKREDKILVEVLDENLGNWSSNWNRVWTRGSEVRGWEGAGFPSSRDKWFPVPKWNPVRLTLVNSSNPYPDRQEILWPMLGSLWSMIYWWRVWNFH